MSKTVIGVLVGSARKGSYSRLMAENVMAMMPENFEMQLLDIADLPMYNQDLDDDNQAPPQWQRLREQVKSMDGYLFVTPEYNRSVPPLLKNALDVASRPYGQNAWGGKPGAVISVSPGKQGAFGANHALRQSMVFLDVYMMQQPEAYIGGAGELFGEDGRIANQGTLGFVQTVANGFAAWVGRFVQK